MKNIIILGVLALAAFLLYDSIIAPKLYPEPEETLPEEE